jgi:4Fe-4S ferredoxin
VVYNLRGQAIKQENLREIVLERSFLTRNYVLRLKKDLCNGCGLCFEVCPHEAIKQLPSTVYEGHLIEKPTIEIDPELCILCGECAVICPLNALNMEVDGEETSTIVKNEAFPTLLKEIFVIPEKCDPECGLKCQEECPKEAIKILTKCSENGELLEISDVQIDETQCIYCKRCELACKQNAIFVKKPLIGRLELNLDLCPEECVACTEICPTHAIQIQNDGLTVSEEFCVFCSACEKVCPNEAIKIYRDWIFHTEVKAAAWLTALKKLTSVETVAKELRIKSGKVRADVVRAREISSHSHSKSLPSNKAAEFLKILDNCRK